MTDTSDNRRPLSYYADRLLSQAVTDPQVNVLEEDELRAYIEEQAAYLCLPQEETTRIAMSTYRYITSNTFEQASALEESRRLF